MPRSHWKGSISFGLVNIPISLFPAENKLADISFHLIDKRDNARIQYQRINIDTGKVVDWQNITRGYSAAKDEVVPVPDDVLKRVAGDNARTIDIESFVPKKDFDILLLQKIYYLVPDKKGEKGYVILREALQQTNRMGIAKVIISTKEYLAAIIPHDNALILCLLKYAKEVKQPEEFDIPNKDLSSYKVTKKEIDIASKLVKAMSAKWNPKKYIDKYQQALHRWIEEEVKDIPHTQMKQRKHAQRTAHVVNFADLLRKSLATNVKSSEKKLPPKAKQKYTHASRH